MMSTAFESHSFEPDKFAFFDEASADAALSGGNWYYQQISKYPPLKPEVEERLWETMKNGSSEEEKEAARKRLIEGNLRLVWSVAKQYQGSSEFLELIQEGNIGLVRAIDRFKVEKGCRLSTYAVFWIQAEILQFLKANSLIRLPRHVADKIAKMKAAEQNLFHRLFSEATVSDLAEELGWSVEELEKTLLECEKRSPVSLDASFADAEGETARTLADMIPDEEKDPLEDAISSERKEKVIKTIERLPQKDKVYMVLHYLEAKTNLETAQVLGLGVDTIKERGKMARKKFKSKFPEDLLQ